MCKTKQLTVTSPLLPPLEEFIPYLRQIWDSRWITNNGQMHQQLEKALAEYLGVEYISLFTNGTLPLITALQALDLRQGEVITTPYSFVATSHSIWWNGLKPVFVDVEPDTGNIDASKIEAAITEKTVAIMPVHVYGSPCDVDAIQAIADKHKLKVIFDAAHAFGVKRHGQSVLHFGDMSTLSFHATKAYTTIEGGALICHSAEMKKKIDFLKNFGFNGETEVVGPGINSKMDEVRAAFGLLNLKYVDAAIARRREIAEKYINALKDVRGIKLLSPLVKSFEANASVRLNYSYFPIFVDAEAYGRTRDELYFAMKEQNVLGRRYFYPLISSFEPYKQLTSASKENLPVANKLADSVICLPLHQEMQEEDVARVIDLIR
ncbi:MAG: DegT/DnrJ/EryC1/StrS family aminotransferase [Bacteroidales bacterium]|nr:DegT/DnrJ/EryC1/StrS family aminotransferase [Bacteroidales bacterium]